MAGLIWTIVVVLFVLWLLGVAVHIGGGLINLPRADNPLELFRYPAARAHHLLGLGQAPVMALSQRGCSGLLSAVDMAAQLLQTAERPAILCLAGDALPAGGRREIMYNLMSDAAGALLVPAMLLQCLFHILFEFLVGVLQWRVHLHADDVFAVGRQRLRNVFERNESSQAH